MNPDIMLTNRPQFLHDLWWKFGQYQPMMLAGISSKYTRATPISYYCHPIALGYWLVGEHGGYIEKLLQSVYPYYTGLTKQRG